MSCHDIIQRHSAPSNRHVRLSAEICRYAADASELQTLPQTLLGRCRSDNSVDNDAIVSLVSSRDIRLAGLGDCSCRYWIYIGLEAVC